MILCGLVLRDRTHNGANRPMRHWQAMEGNRYWLGRREGGPPIEKIAQKAAGALQRMGRLRKDLMEISGLLLPSVSAVGS